MSTKQQTAGQLAEANAKLALQDEQSKKLQLLGLEAIKAVVAVADRYFALITFIREQKVDKKLATHSLTTVGFEKSIVSKLLKIAHAPDDVFDLYAARTVGFNKVLKLTRDAEKIIKGLKPGETKLLEAIDETVTEAEREAEAEEKSKEPVDTVATKTTRLHKVCIQALKLMEALNKKSFTKTREGYTLTIIKASRAAAPASNSPAVK